MDPLDELEQEFLPAQGAQGSPDPLDAFVAQPAAPAPSARSPGQVEVDQMGSMKRIGMGMLGGFEDLGQGITQLAYKAGARMGINAADDRLPELEQESREMAAHKAPLYDTTEGAIGQVLPSLLLPQSTIPRAIASGVAYGAAQPEVEEGDQAGNAVAGGIGMGLGNVAGRSLMAGINRARSPARGGRQPTDTEAERAVAVKEAEDAGLKVSVGARTGGRFARGLESVFEDFPLLSRTMKAFREGNDEAASRALSKQMGEDAAVITRDVIDRAEGRVGAEFEKYVSADAPIVIDKGYMGSMKELKRKVELVAPRQRDPELQGIIKDFYEDIPPTWKRGEVSTSGEAYKLNRTRLANKARTAYRSGAQDIAGQIDQVVRAMDDMATRAVPEELQEGYQLARQQWMGIKIAEDSVDDFGRIVPAKLKGAIQRHIPNERVGGDPYRKLSRSMQLVKEGINNSGTPSRALAMGALGGGGLYLGGLLPGVGGDAGPLDYAQAAALPFLVQRAMLNPVTPRYITRQLGVPGPGQKALVDALGRVGGLGGYAAGQELTQ
jgi:hypothetical protein